MDKTLDSSHVDAFHITKWTQCGRLNKKDYMAIVSHQVEVGDIIYCRFGGSALYVLWPEGDKFWFICEAYVYGLMDGEANGVGIMSWNLRRCPWY